MIVELVFPGATASAVPGLYSVRNYNDDCVIKTTPSLLEAVRLAATEAEAFEHDALVRVHAGRAFDGELSFTTEPTALLAVVILLVTFRALAVAAQYARHLPSRVHEAVASYGDYHGATYRVTFPDAPLPAAAPSGFVELDVAAITCAGCNFTQPLDSFDSRGRCARCGKPTCDMCADRDGRCPDCRAR